MPYAEKVLQGNLMAGARLIRLLEEGDPEGVEDLKLLYPHTGKALVLGITGPPGAGKSTLVDRIISELRSRNRTVGVLAVDPSSPFSGGAILGDRVRMRGHSADEGVFVRSMATRGHLGGLCKTIREAMLVMEAMGFQVILIETVGAGQNEVEVVNLAHTVAVVCIPGMGDDIQAMKAGILEIGSLFVVNKSDLPGADDLIRQLESMLRIRPAAEGQWQPPVIGTSALKNEGIQQVVDAFLAHHAYLSQSGKLARYIQDQELRLFRQTVTELAAEKIFRSAALNHEYHELIEDIKNRKIDPRSAAEKIVASVHFK